MTKSDIMSNSLDQLIEKFHSSPESFEYVDGGNSESVMWQTKINLSDNMISDPTAYQRTILVTWSSYDKTLALRIYNETFDSFTKIDDKRSDAKLSLSRPFEKYRSNYKKFRTLIKLTQEQREHKKTKEFLTKLSSVFPTILDHFILGK